MRLLDFGIAKVETADADMTRTHAGMGTPAYAAPEQLSNAKAVDARADVYSLSVLLYQCVVGALPYDVDSITELVMRMYTEGPRPALEVAPGAPSALARLADAGLAVNPEQRLPDVLAFERLFLEAAASELGGESLGTLPTALPGRTDPLQHVQSTVQNTTQGVQVATPVHRPAASARISPALVALVCVGLGLLAAVAYFGLNARDDPPPASAAPAATVQVSPAQPDQPEQAGSVVEGVSPSPAAPAAEQALAAVLRPDRVRASRHLSGEGNYPPEYVRRGRLVTDAGEVEFDVGEEQRHIEVELPGPTRSVKLVVLSVWPGDRWRDLTITEVEILGRPRVQGAR